MSKDEKEKVNELVLDPWVHRAETMRCFSCMWYAPKGEDIGRCRRYAPSMNGYPVVYPIDWCGEHKIRGNS